MNSYRIGFIIEQALGHITHGQNLQKNVARDGEIEAHWSLPSQSYNSLAHKIPVYKSNWTLQAGWQTRRALSQMARRAHLDALFFHTQVTAVLAQDWMGRIPSIVSLDATPQQYDSLGETYLHDRGPEWLERRKWKLNRDCFHQAKRLVTWSEWAKQSLVDDYQVPEEKITVIPPGVNVGEWTPPSIGQTDSHLHIPLSGSNALPEQIVRILFVGGDLKRKGGQLLIEAFRAVRNEAANWVLESSPIIELHLVTRDALPAEPGLFVYNHLQPNSAELKRLYFNSHIFCLPTYGDCLPMVLSEAGAADLPLVSTQVGAIPEIVRDGETGILIPVGDLVALVSALGRLAREPTLRARMGTRAAEVVRAGYDAETNATRLVDLLKKTAEKDRVRP